MNKTVDFILKVYYNGGKMSENGYTEYGYRGLEEIKRLEEKIIELLKQIEKLKNELNDTDRL